MPTLYMPVIGSGPTPPDIVPTSYPCGHNERAWELAWLIVNDVRQERMVFECDERLAASAQYKADEMIRLNYFGHYSPSGQSPNELVVQHGFPLPGYWLVGNNVESIAGSYQTAQEVVDAWFNSIHHRVHVFGSHELFHKQTRYGAGYAERRDMGPKLHSTIWVFHTAL